MFKRYSIPILALLLALGFQFRELGFYMLGVAYHQGLFVTQDFDAAADWFEDAAALGYAPANNNIGVMYMLGRGYPLNHVRAARHFEIAAEDGIPEAQLNLGLLSYLGKGVRKDGAQAYLWLRLASENGAPGADEQYRRLRGILSRQELVAGEALYAARRDRR